MLRRRAIIGTILSFIFLCGFSAMAQNTGVLRGTVTLEQNGQPLHNAQVTVVQLRRTVNTDEGGQYQFERVPPGTYRVVVHAAGFPDAVATVNVASGETATLDFQMKLSPLREEVTVTAAGQEQLAFEAYQSVETISSIELAQRSHTSIGEVLENEPGVAKRSFGPGSARPVIRGFDGDRVLVLQDGLNVGSLGSQSGDHGEPLDVLNLDRVEIVRGPATLLYGSNAIGGVVNAISNHFDAPDRPQEGLRGYLTSSVGSANALGGGGGGIEYGVGNFLFWGNASGQRTGDYSTPLGKVPNSKTRYGNGGGGLGYYADRGFFAFGYNYDRRRYGVPFAGQIESGGAENAPIDLSMRRHNARLSGGLRDLDAFITGLRFSLDYADYQHKELEGDVVRTTFNNKQYAYRGLFDQKKVGRWSGSFGFSGLHRDYETIGAETLAPPVRQNVFAAFTLQQIDFERFGFQFGGRIENTRYRPTGAPDRSFTGFSGAAGMRFNLAEGWTFVANYTHSYRAPALEELYNNGPHIGTLTFEVGNPNLRRELGNGLDLSLRHSSRRVRAEANFFYYRIKDFVFLAPTGEIEDGLPVANYSQAKSRYSGAELKAEIGLVPDRLFLDLGFDTVKARIISTDTPLPRIPPTRGRVGLDFRFNGLSVRPEVVLADRQNDIFPLETPTAGYAVFNLLASYTIPRQHYLHVFGVEAFNLGDRLYRNHVSFIKDLAPEIGRGVRFNYTLRFF